MMTFKSPTNWQNSDEHKKDKACKQSARGKQARAGMKEKSQEKVSDYIRRRGEKKIKWH